MGPMIGSALIQAGGSLLGGLFGKKPLAPSQMIKSHMKGIRLGAEANGFNPLAWAGTGATQGAAPPNYMGAAIADATAAVADAWSNEAYNNAQVDQLEMQNEMMRRELNSAKITPDVPGLYGRAGWAGGGAPLGGVAAVSVPVAVTQTAYQNPEGGATTTVPEGADLEDIGTGLLVEGINVAKNDGRIPTNWEEPFFNAGRSLAASAVDTIDGFHRMWYYGLRGAQEFPFEGNESVPHDWWAQQFGVMQ